MRAKTLTAISPRRLSKKNVESLIADKVTSR
jgi:hypothetical protein